MHVHSNEKPSHTQSRRCHLTRFDTNQYISGKKGLRNLLTLRVVEPSVDVVLVSILSISVMTIVDEPLLTLNFWEELRSSRVWMCGNFHLPRLRF